MSSNSYGAPLSFVDRLALLTNAESLYQAGRKGEPFKCVRAVIGEITGDDGEIRDVAYFQSDKGVWYRSSASIPLAVARALITSEDAPESVSLTPGVAQSRAGREYTTLSVGE